MDELNAANILGVKPGASREEIKAAYAELSRRYHPEEYPEEFQRIHEAYRTLSRTAGQTKPSSVFEEEEAQAEEDLKFKKISMQEEEQESSYDFEKTLGEAEAEVQAHLQETIRKALAEVQILLQPEYCEKMRLFKKFFQKPEYQEAFCQPEFLQGFADMLERASLKKLIYRYIISYYHFREAKPKELNPQAAALYQVLDKKCGMKYPNRTLQYVGIPAGIIAGVRAGLRSSMRDNFMLLSVFFLCVAVFAGGIWSYRKLHENHSSMFAQAILAGILLVTQMFAMLTDFYGLLFGQENAGLLLAGFLFLGAGVWLVILATAAVIKKALRWRK